MVTKLSNTENMRNLIELLENSQEEIINERRGRSYGRDTLETHTDLYTLNRLIDVLENIRVKHGNISVYIDGNQISSLEVVNSWMGKGSSIIVDFHGKKTAP